MTKSVQLIEEMNKEQFCMAIKLPRLWLDNGLYSDKFFEAQISECIGSSSRLNENGYLVDGEHYRNALYWHSLRNGLSKEDVVDLVLLDPDIKLRDWFLREVGKAK